MAENYQIQSIVTEDRPDLLVAQAKRLADRMNTEESTRTQMRRLFVSLRQIERGWPARVDNPEDRQQRDDAYRELLLFVPRLAYETSRHPKLKDLSDTLQAGIAVINKDQREMLIRLTQFFEAVLAFHLYYDKFPNERPSKQQRN